MYLWQPPPLTHTHTHTTQPHRLPSPLPAVKQQIYLEDETPSYGTDTLEDFFRKAVKEGLKGQELGDQAVFGVNES